MFFIALAVADIINPLGFTLNYKVSLDKKTISEKKTKLIIIKLFLCVLMISNVYKDPYYSTILSSSSNISNFDLFYYTVIAFTTIGYGDIVPNSIPSKIIAIIIAFTSVFCLILFVSSMLSIKDRIGVLEEDRGI